MKLQRLKNQEHRKETRESWETRGGNSLFRKNERRPNFSYPRLSIDLGVASTARQYRGGGSLKTTRGGGAQKVELKGGGPRTLFVERRCARVPEDLIGWVKSVREHPRET